jgi:hypothetical protein
VAAVISEALFEAADEVRRHLSDPVFADAYPPGPLRDRVEALVAEIEGVRATGRRQLRWQRMTPQETLRPGDRVLIDPGTGKLRLAVAGEMGSFNLPPDARFNGDMVEWDL